jgi:hypothetical protein
MENTYVEHLIVSHSNLLPNIRPGADGIKLFVHNLRIFVMN